MHRLTSIAFLTALASLSFAGACSKSDDGGGSQAPQQPGTAAAPAPAEAHDPAAGGDIVPGLRGRKDMSPEERRAARREERLRQFDADKDGRLSRDERVTMRAAMVDMRMQRIDRDGDGKISRQEAQSGRMGPRLLADFDRADRNRDSTISRDELAAAVEEFRARRRAERQQAGSAPAAPRTAPAAPQPEEEYDSLDE
ncbi:MAG TPA: hypothetical protein VFU21_06770 [Kofleriaceae bacterium]|nr:hypothetical protein [Kofleriaceae bacterium]